MSIRPMFLVCLVVMLTGCASTAARSSKPGFVNPPREKCRTMEANETIKIGEVLQLRLPDGSTATLAGAYQVGPEGMIEVAGAGKVQVAGKTLAAAREELRKAIALSSGADVAFDIIRHDCFLVTVTGDGVQSVARVPLTLKGPMTVKDAVRSIPQLPSKVIWIARPDPASKVAGESLLPIDWEGIARGDASKNLALQPGDFLFVADEPVKGFGRLYDAVTNMGTSSSEPKTGDAHTSKKTGS